MTTRSNNNVLSRFRKFKIINNLIDNKIKNASNKCLIHSHDSSYLYSFNNNIFLLKRIGLESSDGAVYLTYVEISKKKYYLITKIQLVKDLREIQFLEIITKYAIQNKNIHLPFVYGHLKCNEFNKFDLALPTVITNNRKKLNTNAYYSIFAELAEGDIIKYTESMLLTTRHLYNCIAQCFIAIISCHNSNIFHRDSHIGNFLYHKIKSGGCFEYKYGDLTFYIENIGYNWVIWDFGRSVMTDETNKDLIYNDFLLLIETILDEQEDNSNFFIMDKNILNLIKNLINKYKDDYKIIEKILENNILFSFKPIGNIITTVILK